MAPKADAGAWLLADRYAATLVVPTHCARLDHELKFSDADSEKTKDL